MAYGCSLRSRRLRGRTDWTKEVKTSLGNVVTPYLFIHLFIILKLYVVSVYVQMSTDALGARRGHWVPWSWSSRQLSNTLWVLGIELRLSGRTVHPTNH